MRFAAAIWLWLLPLPALLWVLLRWNDARAAGRLRALLGERAPAHVEGADVRLRARRRFLLFSGLVCLILALARPQWGAHDVVVKERGTDVVVALDVSNSMLSEDVSPSRLGRAKDAIGSFLEGLDRGRVGLVLFAGAAYVQCPLTLDYATARLFLAQASPDMITAQGTALATALATSRELLERGGGPAGSAERAILLVTDGEDFEGNLEQETAKCRDAGIVVFTIGVGDPRGGLIPRTDPEGRSEGFLKDDQGAVVMSRPDFSALAKVADTTGGAQFQLGAAGLDVPRLRSLLAKLGERELEERRISSYEERFMWPLALALICLAAREARRPRRKPAEEARGDAAPAAGASAAARGSLAGAGAGRGAGALGPGGARGPGAASLLLALLLVATAGIAPARAGGGLRPAGAGLADRGRSLYRQGKYAEALQAFEAARALNPDDARLTLAVGETLARLSRADEADREFQRALSQTRDVDLRAESLYNAGTARLGAQDPAAAIKLLRQALALAPDREDARRNLELALRALQEQQQQQQSGQQQKQDQQQQNQQQQQNGQQQQQGQQKDQQNQQQQQQQDRKQQQQDQQQQAQQEQAAEQMKGTPQAMTREEALAILRALDRDELELRRSVQKRLHGGENRSGKTW